MRHLFKNRLNPYLAVLVILVAVISTGGRAALGETGRTGLWSVTSGTNTVYLLGSIHLLSRWEYPLPAEFEKAYGHSAVVVFETDLDEMDDPQTQALMMQHSLLPKKHTIREYLSADTYRLLENHLAAGGLDMVRFEGLRPWVCALTLTMLELRKRGYLPAYGLDRYFYQKAKNDRKTIIPLEPVQEPLALLFELGRQEQDAFLKRTLTDLDQVEILFPEMLALWKSGDIQALDKMTQKSFAAYPVLHDRLLVQRNKKWLPAIVGLIGQPQNALVIVGASHLGGEDGVIRMLERAGYPVVQK